MTSSAPITRKRFPSAWRCNRGGSYFRAMCLWCFVHLAQAGIVNNYTRVLYIQGACIFMQGVVMECMVRLVRLGVGGNFFHTLGFKRLAHQCNPKLFPIQVLFRWASTAHPCQIHRRSRRSPNALDVFGVIIEIGFHPFRDGRQIRKRCSPFFGSQNIGSRNRFR